LQIVVDRVAQVDIMAPSRQQTDKQTEAIQMNNNETVQQELAAIRDRQERIQDRLGSDLAYQYSVENDDIMNMMMVLKAHGEPSTFRDAELQVQWGQIVESITEYNATA